MKIESIPDPDSISRHLFWPRMFGLEGVGPLDPNAFFEFPSSSEFPSGQPESVVWRKYKPTDEEVHRLGCEAEIVKRMRKPNARYTGCRDAIVEEVRKFQTARGHGFKVLHEPSEGIHHAEISYLPKNQDATGLKKADKGELRLALANIFKHEKRHDCALDTLTASTSAP